MVQPSFPLKILIHGRTVSRQWQHQRHSSPPCAQWSFLVAMVESIRFQYHHSYLIVIAGATLCGVSRTPALYQALLSHYLLFNIALYGGIYLLNGILDAPLDAMHPVKCRRPIPSGRIPLKIAWGLLAVMWTAAFGGVYAYDGDARLWPLFAGFVAANLWYPLRLRRTEWRCLVGCTQPLRVHLGWTLAARIAAAAGMHVAPLPAAVYMCFAAGACALQALEFRIEATGETQGVARGAPLEVTTTLAVVTNVMLLMHESAEVRSLGVFWVLLAGTCTYIPIFSPKQSWLFGTKLPFDTGPHRRLLILRALWQLRDAWGLCMWVLLTFNSAFNFLCMGWEDSLFGVWSSVQNALLPFNAVFDFLCMGWGSTVFAQWTMIRAPLKKVAFILGPEGSQCSKHLHRALMQDPECHGASVFDTWFPSITCKILFWPLRKLVSGMCDPAEEHMFCMHYCRTHKMFKLFPSLLRHKELPMLMHEMYAFQEFDVLLMRRCMQRVSFMHGAKGWYIARPLAMARCYGLLQQVFPEAKYVVVGSESSALSDASACMEQLPHACGIAATTEALQRYQQIYADQCSSGAVEALTLIAIRAHACAASSRESSGTDSTHAADAYVVGDSKWAREPHAEVAQVLSWLLGTTISPMGALKRMSSAVRSLMGSSGGSRALGVGEVGESKQLSSRRSLYRSSSARKADGGAAVCERGQPFANTFAQGLMGTSTTEGSVWGW